MKEYSIYENFDAIEVPYTDAIPSDYKGYIGVPVTFLEKYALKEKLYITEKTQRRSSDDKNLVYFNKLSAEKAMDFMKKKKEKG